MGMNRCLYIFIAIFTFPEMGCRNAFWILRNTGREKKRWHSACATSVFNITGVVRNGAAFVDESIRQWSPGHWDIGLRIFLK
jgi:hypothetical protein